ncbi:MAG: peptidoglycan editing factor PgeF [Streptosporangiaceae bacterium]
MQLTGRVQATFTDRIGGTSSGPYDSRNLGGTCGDAFAVVLRNRHKTACDLGLDPERVVFMNQVHGADVRYVTGPVGDEPLDAVFTDQPGLALAVLVADCGPVLLADPVAGLVGAAHSGRVGTELGVVPALVEAMTGAGADPGRMTAMIGPLACGGCYEVPLGLREAMARLVPGSAGTTREGTPSIDLRAAITAQLGRWGVTDIRHDDRCTLESPELYSHRRDQPTGRFAGYVWLGP